MVDDMHQMLLSRALVQMPHILSLCLVLGVSIPFPMLLLRKLKYRDVICLKSRTSSRPVDNQEFFSDALDKLAPQRL